MTTSKHVNQSAAIVQLLTSLSTGLLALVFDNETGAALTQRKRELWAMLDAMRTHVTRWRIDDGITPAWFPMGHQWTVARAVARAVQAMRPTGNDDDAITVAALGIGRIDLAEQTDIEEDGNG